MDNRLGQLYAHGKANGVVVTTSEITSTRQMSWRQGKSSQHSYLNVIMIRNATLENHLVHPKNNLSRKLSISYTTACKLVWPCNQCN